jgi:hypothetical protein
MITYVPKEEVMLNWGTIRDTLAEFWDTTLNFETLDNLKARLLADECQLWMHSNPDRFRVLFITESSRAAKANILTVTHTAGYNLTNRRFTKKDLRALLTQAFAETEAVAKSLGFDALCVNARPANVELLKYAGYDLWTTKIIKQFPKEEE